MIFDIIFLNRKEFFSNLQVKRVTFSGLFRLLLLFSIAFALLAWSNNYFLYKSKLEYLESSLQDQRLPLEMQGISVDPNVLSLDGGIMLPDFDVALQLFILIVGYIIKIFIISLMLFLFLKILGHGYNLIEILNICIQLSPIWLIILALSTIINAAFYLLLGNVSLLNMILMPTVGSVIYYIRLGQYFRERDVSLFKSVLITLPFIALSLSIVILDLYYNFVYLNSMADLVIYQLGL